MGNKDRVRRGKRKKYNGNQHECAKRKKREEMIVKTVFLGTNNDNNNVAAVTVNDGAEIPCSSSQSQPLAENNTTAHDISSSEKKLKSTIGSMEHQENEKDFYFLFNSSILKELVQCIGHCQECLDDNVELIYCDKRKLGLCKVFLVKCHKCGWEQEFMSSKKKTKTSNLKGVHAFDVNVRSIIAFREIGKGHAAMQSFCSIMNMHPPMCRSSYQKTVSNLHTAYGFSSLNSMKRAAKEAPASGQQNDDGIKNVQASFDGTWQRRGFSSLHGVVTCISGGKCVDVASLSKECMQCKIWEKRKDTEKYEAWKNRHVCPINHRGSAGAMEASGAQTMFKRSVQQKKLRYLTYRGDGDSKSFSEVVKSDPYPGFTITKAECVGHVQKRVGSRLRTLRVTMKGKKLSDGKGISGKGRLTDKIINSLQNFYGSCIRSNKGDLYGMKKGIAAIINHCSENPDAALRHQYCPRGEDTWCKYHETPDKASYKPRINLPKAIADIVKPIFSHKDLGSDDLLKRCLDGETQNANEALNQLIWKKCPKDTFVGKQILDIAVSSAVLQYNDGGSGLLKVFKQLGLTPGTQTRLGLVKCTKDRIALAIKKHSDVAKLSRKRLSAKKKGHHDKIYEKEGDMYKSGAS